MNNNIFTIRHHFITWGITLILSGLFLLSDLWNKIKPGESISKIAKGILNASQIYGAIPYICILLGVVIFFCSVYKYFSVGLWYFCVTIVALISSLVLFLGWSARSKIGFLEIVLLIILIAWVSYTVILILMRLYKWIVSDTEKMLPKITLVWTIIAALLGYIWGIK